ncbi:BrnA antitoxin family protein [Nitrospira defluvii]|nr:BrnA antitoxin family protein [Nitrospira defluvii]
MKNSSKKISNFKNEDEERKFWDTHSPLEYFDLESAKTSSFPALKPSLKSISIRLPENILDTLKVLANKQDVPYQSLIKIFLARQIEQEKAIQHAKPSRSKKRPSTLKHVEPIS